jgi:HK97 gp10 family phage protein
MPAQGLVTLETKGLDKLQESMGQAAAEFPLNVKQAMQLSLLTLESDMRSNVPRDTGQLGNSISYHMSGSGANIQGDVGPTAAYWPFVTGGTKPHWPPIAAITPWAHRHGIPPFLVARAIARHGTKAHPFVQESFDHNWSRIQEFFAAAGAKVQATVRGI